MKKMQITAQLPKKDAYKGQATHHHECMAKPNLVNRNFKLGVRQVILTDITYMLNRKFSQYSNRKLFQPFFDGIFVFPD